MKILTTAILSTLILMACSPKNEHQELETKNDLLTFDSLKANRFGADDYGMKTYVMAFLKKGPVRPTDSLESQRLQNAHMANISRLAQEGKLVLAGPFYGNDSLRGIYIFNTRSLDSAMKWTQTDPAIQQKSLKMDLKLWYGSAALMGINEVHPKISKKKI